MNITELRRLIIDSNKAYRTGKPFISDLKYDALVEELKLMSPDDDLLTAVGLEVLDESRKAKLPIEMASMNKVKTLEEIRDWMNRKDIPTTTTFIITPKFDGISLCVNEKDEKAWTRGDGEYGSNSDEHYKLIGNKMHDSAKTFKGILFSYGELMMPKKTFIDKYSQDFANPRNLVGGQINTPDPTDILKDCLYIKYGLVHYPMNPRVFDHKHELLNFLNSGQEHKVDFVCHTIDKLSEEYLVTLFHEWSKKFEIDGLIIEVNDLCVQSRLGREKSSKNPCWARAYKSVNFEESKETLIKGITWNVSKQKYLKPIINVDPINLNGVTISNVTGNNARFIQNLRLGAGALIKIRRSGGVIPFIADVVSPSLEPLPTVCSSCNTQLYWNDNQVELVCRNEDCGGGRLKKIISFFKILEVDQVSEGVLTQIYDAGYETIKDILNLKKDDLEKLEGFGKRKAEIVYTNIQSKIKDVELSKLQHASGVFDGLGSKKLVLLESFESKPSLSIVMAVDGFAETSAKIYIDGYDKFNEFIKDLPITIKKKSKIIGGDFAGQSFCFTGVRDKNAESIIESKGGKISGSVSKNLTFLITKEKDSGSSKEEKAKQIGVKILTLDELQKMLD